YANKAVAVLLIVIGVLVITGLWNSVSLWIVDNSSWFPTL
ncbi:cytochrome C biogenesis protein, partial [Rathayibacter sp. AY1C7]